MVQVATICIAIFPLMGLIQDEEYINVLRWPILLLHLFLLFSNGTHPEIVKYTKQIELDPTNASAYSNRGNAKKQLKDDYGAIADYSKAIEIDPNDVSAYNNRGNIKKQLKDDYGAIADYKKAIEIYPNSAFAKKQLSYYENRGVAV